jgi:dTDP-4-dehydrorhamnose reductase
LGNTLYRELLPYFDVYGTYLTKTERYTDNQVFYRFDSRKDNLLSLLDTLQPGWIIDATVNSEQANPDYLQQLCAYCQEQPGARVVRFSSPAVFDARTRYPSYETDRPVAETATGKAEIAAEKLLLEHIPDKLLIARLPIMLGTNAPVVIQLREAIRNKAHFEVFPNHVVSVSTADKAAQQLHYLISKRKSGIYHLSSSDVIHHDELFYEIAMGLGNSLPVFDYVYLSNEDRYCALLPGKNKLPPPYRITVAEAIEFTVLSDQITTLKKQL